MPRVQLVMPGQEVLAALKTGRDQAATLLGRELPDGWPEHPVAIDFTLAALREQPQHERWHLRLFVDPEIGCVVGSGGYKGPPQDGAVEIGYEIAPAFRGRGYATAAARQLVQQVPVMDPQVTCVLAHTLALENPSASVLRNAGFQHRGEAADPGVGRVWRWELELPGEPS